MRRIGSVSSEHQAQTIRDYLFTREIDVQVDQGSDGWNVWVLDEDRVDEARRELDEFQADPQAQKYAAAATQAQARRQALLDEEISVRKRQVNMRDRWERPVYQRIPVTIMLIVVSVGVTMTARPGDDLRIVTDGPGRAVVRAEKELTEKLVFQESMLRRGETLQLTITDIRNGEVWRLITPIFLHFGVLHIVMNMYMLFVFGGSIEEPKGPWRFLAFVLMIAATSNFAQFIMGGPLFGGMSGVDYGLFGYLWMKSRFAPEEGFYMPRIVVIQLVIFTLLCLSGVIPHIANTAHMVGLGTGMVIALTPVWIRYFSGR